MSISKTQIRTQIYDAFLKQEQETLSLHRKDPKAIESLFHLTSTSITQRIKWVCLANLADGKESFPNATQHAQLLTRYGLVPNMNITSQQAAATLDAFQEIEVSNTVTV